MTSAVVVKDMSFSRPKQLRIDGANIFSGLSTQVERGERVALLGRNGSGKTTLLRLLAGILKPSSGSIEIVGSVSSLINPSFAMSEVLSARENCRTRLILDGVARGRLGPIVDEIEQFVQIGKLFHQPMHTLSAGMWSRITFALMTAIPRDVLLIDEGFGLADSVFRRQSVERLDDLYHNAQALILASHDNSLLMSVCSRGLVLNDRSIAFDGEIDEAIAFYERLR